MMLLRMIARLGLIAATALGILFCFPGIALLAALPHLGPSDLIHGFAGFGVALGIISVGVGVSALSMRKLRREGSGPIKSITVNRLIAVLGAMVLVLGALPFMDTVFMFGVRGLFDPGSIFFGGPLIAVGSWCVVGATTNLRVQRKGQAG